MRSVNWLKINTQNGLEQKNWKQIGSQMIFVIHSLFQFCMYIMDAFVILVGLWFVYEKVWYLWYKKEFDYLAMIFRQETNIEGFYQNL